MGSRPVSRVLSRTAIHLRRLSPGACSDLPGSRTGRTLTLPYLVLLQVGFTLPPMLPPATRCALTAPFHPYPVHPEGCPGGIFSVALSVGSRPPGVTCTLPCGARTFLPPRAASDCLTGSGGFMREMACKRKGQAGQQSIGAGQIAAICLPAAHQPRLRSSPGTLSE